MKSNDKIKNNDSKSYNKINLSQSLNQGKKFKKYQNKIQNNLVKEDILLNKEGFGNNNLTKKTREIIQKNSYTSQDEENLADLREEYQSTLQEYQELLEKVSGSINGYVERTNNNNPFLNKVVSFTTGENAYVTNQGVVKIIPSIIIWKTLNISQTVQVTLSIPWQSSYNTPGTQIPTKPPLISGTPIKSGQSLGNEGSNVFVDQLLPSDVTTSYMGCYAASPNNDNMTFIGGSPPPLNGAQIQNGTFSQPTLGNNSYQYINSSSQVPGWYFGGGCLLNNSTAWGYPIPYPNSNQCVSIQNSNYINTSLNLNTGVNYTLLFYCCGRNCCTGQLFNPINVQLYTSNNAFISTIASVFPPVNKWTQITLNFTVPTTQTYKLFFSGTNNSGDQSSAITNITINTSSTSSGTYSYNDCEQAAIEQGYKYFALQNVNTTNNLGYCAVSNSEPAVVQYGNSQIPNKLIPLWASNTSGQSGNNAILSVTGSLQVLSSSGQSVYSTPGTNANPANYLGCYGDNSSRAMSTAYNNGSQQYSNSQCQQVAKQNGYQYYGLQNSTSGTNAQCFLSNNLSQTMEYGTATNCTKISDGSWSGGGWSNAVYNTNNPQSNYFLILQDDGNVCIYRGSGPNDNQGFIWETATNGKQQIANPNTVATLGKYGKNWISSGSTLAPGDFIGSTNGNLQLIMQSDGNLVLYTFQMGSNCQKMSDGNMGGGIGGNAAYNIGMTSINSNMGELAFIDADSNLYSYPSSNKEYKNTYSTTFEDSNTTGNDIQGSSFDNATVQSCQSACNTNSTCAGFVFDNTNNICYPKTNAMYPFGGPINSDPNLTIYLRDVEPSSPPTGVSENTVNIDTVTYQNYNNNGNIGSNYGLSNSIPSVQKQQLQQLQTKLNQLASTISDSTTRFQKGTRSAESQSNKNVIGLQDYIKKIESDNKLSLDDEKKSNMKNILDDSSILVLQRNYSYLLWSILAASTVLITMNVVKKQ
jgi:hypothetical protein